MPSTSLQLKLKNRIDHFFFIKRVSYILLILFVTAFSSTIQSCSILIRDQESVAQKKQEKEDKKNAAEYEKARKKHYKNQSKETKKSMKQTEKRAAKYNKSKKRGFFSGTKCD